MPPYLNHNSRNQIRPRCYRLDVYAFISVRESKKNRKKLSEGVQTRIQSFTKGWDHLLRICFVLFIILIGCKSGSQKVPNKESAGPFLSDGLYAIVYAKGNIPAMVQEEDQTSSPREIVYILYYIRDKNRSILIDPGPNSESTRKRLGIEDWISPIQILERNGIPAKSVSEIVLTDSLPEHSESLTQFPNPIVYAHKATFDSLLKKNRNTGAVRYLQERKRSGNLRSFDSSLELLPGLRILITEGRTEGSIALEWLRNGGRRVLITGGECILIQDCLKEEVSLERNLFSPKRNREFLDYLRLLEDSGTRILTMHDPEIPKRAEEIRPGFFKIQ